MKHRQHTSLVLLVFSLLIIACNLPFIATGEPAPTATLLPPPIPAATHFSGEINTPTLVPPTSAPSVVHIAFPETSPPSGGIIYDVVSHGTANENRAPYGDSYKINRLERPFTQDMTYIPDLDIVTYTLSSDGTWYYVSIEMFGKNPNNEIGINFGVEIDNDTDGFGDVIVWGQPPYTREWTNETLQVIEDSNHDSAGLSAGHSDAPLDTNGYDTPIFNLSDGLDTDPDLAWVRSDAGINATIQFAFKKSLTDGGFMLGVLADAGLRDVGKLDYVDRFRAEDAGSPVRDNQYYPLGELYLIDNTCFEAFGYTPTGYEPKLCPRTTTPTRESGEQSGETTTVECKFPLSHDNAASCQAAGCVWKQTSSNSGEISYCGRP